MNKEKFYNTIRPLFGGKLSTSQVDGMERIFKEWNASNFTDLRWLAYIFATSFHETAQRMQPIEEFGRGKGRPYGKKLKHSGVPYTRPNKIYYGRGHVQLTWFENYELMGRLLHVDLLNYPELALDKEISIKIMFEGMTKGSSSIGDFTGKSLENYFNSTVEDWEGARKIINGNDKKKLIAGYAKKFYEGLK